MSQRLLIKISWNMNKINTIIVLIKLYGLVKNTKVTTMSSGSTASEFQFGNRYFDFKFPKVSLTNFFNVK